MESICIQNEGLNKLIENIKPISDFIKNNKIIGLKNQDAVYSFWWMNDMNFERLLSLNLEIAIKGKKNREKEYLNEPRTIYNSNWKIDHAINERLCLYVGKSNYIVDRLNKHLYLSFKKHWYEDAADKFAANMIHKTNTVCQFRAGIEHLFKKETDFKLEEVLRNHIGISVYHPDKESKDENMEERFYLEDLAIGYLRPWFNLDSER